MCSVQDRTISKEDEVETKVGSSRQEDGRRKALVPGKE